MIHFTHNDLDALGSMLCINLKYKDKITKVYHTYYGDFEKQVDEIIKDKDDIVIITDLSFAERPESLLKLIQNKKFVQLIDHHSYPENFWIEFDKNTNFKRIINDKYCASLSCYELYNNCLQSDEDSAVGRATSRTKRTLLHALCKLIDVYDCWREGDGLFPSAQKLNLWFWTKNIDDLCKAIENNGYKFPDGTKAEIETLYTQQQNAVEEAYKNNKVFKVGPVTFVFDNDVFNPILIKEMSEGQELVVCCFQFKNGDFCFKVRVKQGLFDDCALDRLRLRLAGKITGHPNAFSYVKKFNNSLELEKEYKRIVEEFMDITDDSIPF